MRIKPLIGPVAVTLLLSIFVWAISGRVVAMFQTGQPAVIGIAVGVSLTMVVGVLILVQEWRLAMVVQKMSKILAARGELIEDTLPRSPGGRIDRAAADEQFNQLRTVTQANPQSWEAWFNLAFGYDAAGDRKQARATLRQSARLFRTSN